MSHSPTQVFLLGQQLTAASVTGTLTETTLFTLPVPGNTMGANGILDITWMTTCTNNANAKTFKIKLGSTTFRSTSPSSTLTTYQGYFIANRNATNSQIGPVSNWNTGSASGQLTGAEDTTTNLNLLITCTLGNTGDTATLDCVFVRLSRPN